MKKNASWPILKKPPVIMALFQLIFEEGAISLFDYDSCDRELNRIFPNKRNTIESNFRVPGSIAIGVSKFEADTKVAGHTYFSTDQKMKLDLRSNNITFIDERMLYQGWDIFKDGILQNINILTPLLEKIIVKRISIRFINRFDFEAFDNPSDFFNTIIAINKETEKEVLPVNAFNFRLSHQIPTENKDDIYAIVTHNFEEAPNKYLYFFDIDVLERVNLIYNQSTILEKLERLRGIKNDIFFENLTEKTISLCN